jgi:putative transposase
MAVSRLGALHRRIAHQRSDWLHKLTTQLADRHAVVALEDLRIKNMSASARGTDAQPGKNVNAKAGLDRGITDAAWGEFARQLTYKVQWRGGRVILVDAAYASRECRLCAYESAENRKTQALFSCVACGHTENADVHAAKNILARGMERWREEVLPAGRAASACGRGGQPTVRRKTRGRSPGEAGTHRSKGLGLSFSSHQGLRSRNPGASGPRGCQ